MPDFNTFTRAQVHAELDVLMNPNLDVFGRLQAYLRLDDDQATDRKVTYTKLTKGQRQCVRDRVASGERKSVLAKEYDVVEQTIRNIVRERAK